MTEQHWRPAAGAALVVLLVAGRPLAAQTGGRATGSEFGDSHFHLTNHVQEGPDVRAILA